MQGPRETKTGSPYHPRTMRPTPTPPRVVLVASAIAACAGRAPTPPAATPPQPVAVVSAAPVADAATAPLDAAAPVAPADPPPSVPICAAEILFPSVEVLRAFESARGASPVQTCARRSCAVAATGPELPTGLVREHAALPPPVRAWWQIVEAGASVRVAGDAAVDLFGVVLDGEARVRPIDPRAGSARTVPRRSAFVLPGGAVVSGVGSAPVALLLAAARGEGASAPRRMVVRDVGAVPPLSFREGRACARIVFEVADSTRASLGVLSLLPTTSVAAHTHPAWEVLAMLSADGRVSLGAGAETRDYRYRGGAIAYVPQGMLHAWEPGDATDETGHAAAPEAGLVAVQLYAPPGPEQRFRALATPR